MPTVRTVSNASRVNSIGAAEDARDDDDNDVSFNGFEIAVSFSGSSICG